MLGSHESIVDYQYRYPRLLFFVFLAVLLLYTRLVFLQLVNGTHYRSFSERNFLRREKIPGPRGQILDRDGRLLVDNRLQLDISVHPQLTKNRKEALEKLSELSGEPYEKILDRFNQRLRQVAPFQSVTVVTDAPWNLIVKVENIKDEFPGMEVEVRIRRTYLDGEAGAHVYGYLSEVNKADLNALNEKGFKYEQGDWVGRSGIERQLESTLRGKDGSRVVIVNAHGKRLETSVQDLEILKQIPAKIESKTGQNLVLTLDQDLQRTAARALHGKMGSVVALDPRTGEILAMVSQPSFDPTEMATNAGQLWGNFIKSPYGPLRNKSIQDHYPPGSTFKVFTALAGLEAGLIDENKAVNCPGSFRFGSRVFHCHKKEGHGPVSLLQAISGSCDVYFYSLAAKLGVDPISRMASFFGLGRKTGIELPDEVPGLMPTEAWKQKARGQAWSPGETLSVAIGQGAALVTPLQLALSYSTLVNGGNLYRPYLVSRIENAEGAVIKENKPELLSNHKFNEEHLRLIKQGLYDVVNKVGGTAFGTVHRKDNLISGKSGTAQVVSLSKEELFAPCQNLPLNKRHHAWFVGYAPPTDTEIVVVTLGLHECGGSRTAGPVVKAMIDAWWNKKMIKAPGPLPAAR